MYTGVSVVSVYVIVCWCTDLSVLVCVHSSVGLGVHVS